MHFVKPPTNHSIHESKAFFPRGLNPIYGNFVRALSQTLLLCVPKERNSESEKWNHKWNEIVTLLYI